MSDVETKKILIVDDDPGLQKQLKWCFSDYDATVAGDRPDAVEKIESENFPVVLLDLGLPPDPANSSEGFKLLSEIFELCPDTKVIVVSGNDTRENALQAVSQGAYDFYQKPIEPDELKLIVERAYRLYELERENKLLLQKQSTSTIDGFITSNPKMRDICRQIEKVAPSDITVLLLGESGTGKELMARSVYDLGSKRDGVFVAINCAAIPENLLESELFGYEKGAFTGADKRTIGKIEHAHKGVLFLDEVGDLPLSLQAKLLRFLQERVIERLGGREEIAVDVRIVCATHQNLRDKIITGDFREDLFYRISEITIDIPPIRERVGDAVLLAQYFIKRYKGKGQARIKLSKAAIIAIEQHDWPGNARELENKVKRALIFAESNIIQPADLELKSPDNSEDLADILDLKVLKQQLEHDAILKALGRTEGKLTEAAKLLGVSRPTIYDLIEKYNIKQS